MFSFLSSNTSEEKMESNQSGKSHADEKEYHSMFRQKKDNHSELDPKYLIDKHQYVLFIGANQNKGPVSICLEYINQDGKVEIKEFSIFRFPEDYCPSHIDLPEIYSDTDTIKIATLKTKFEFVFACNCERSVCVSLEKELREKREIDKDVSDFLINLVSNLDNRKLKLMFEKNPNFTSPSVCATLSNRCTIL